MNQYMQSLERAIKNYRELLHYKNVSPQVRQFMHEHLKKLLSEYEKWDGGL